MMHMLRRSALFAGFFALLAACGGDVDAGSAASDSAKPVSGPANDAADIALGPQEAAVTVIEYASTTCPACRQFHNTVAVPVLKAYADEGKIRYVFREFPTAPANIATASSVIARCAGRDRYFDVLDDLFDNQPGIIAAAQQGAAGQALAAIAGRHGIDQDGLNDCLRNETYRDAVLANQQRGIDDEITGTPTLFLNGRRLTGAEGRTAASMTELLDAALAEASSGETTEGETPVDPNVGESEQ